MTEHMVLSLAGATAGLAIAWWGAGMLRALGRDLIPRSTAIHLDGYALAFSLGLAILIGVSIGALPGLLARQNEAQGLLPRGGHRSDTKPGH